MVGEEGEGRGEEGEEPEASSSLVHPPYTCPYINKMEPITGRHMNASLTGIGGIPARSSSLAASFAWDRSDDHIVHEEEGFNSGFNSFKC
jgi:hypothetical protein